MVPGPALLSARGLASYDAGPEPARHRRPCGCAWRMVPGPAPWSARGLASYNAGARIGAAFGWPRAAGGRPSGRCGGGCRPGARARHGVGASSADRRGAARLAM